MFTVASDDLIKQSTKGNILVTYFHLLAISVKIFMWLWYDFLFLCNFAENDVPYIFLSSWVNRQKHCHYIYGLISRLFKERW